MFLHPFLWWKSEHNFICHPFKLWLIFFFFLSPIQSVSQSWRWCKFPLSSSILPTFKLCFPLFLETYAFRLCSHQHSGHSPLFTESFRMVFLSPFWNILSHCLMTAHFQPCFLPLSSYIIFHRCRTPSQFLSLLFCSQVLLGPHFCPSY